MPDKTKSKGGNKTTKNTKNTKDKQSDKKTTKKKWIETSLARKKYCQGGFLLWKIWYNSMS